MFPLNGYGLWSCREEAPHLELYHGKIADTIADADTLSSTLFSNPAQAKVDRAAGRPVEFHQYSGTGHWFFEPDRPQAFNQTAADLE